MTAAIDPRRFKRFWQRQRYAVLAAIVLLLAAGAVFVIRPMTTPPEARRVAPAIRPVATTPTTHAANDEAGPAAPVDIFAVRTWEPPPPAMPSQQSARRAPRVIEPPPPPPDPPALPFSFLGRVVEPGKAPAFMLVGAGGEVLAARVGDTLQGDYLLEQYTGGNLTFLYRPMNIRQTLAIGE